MRTPPASLLVLGQRDTPEEGLTGDWHGKAVFVGELDRHDDAVVFKDFPELPELDLVIKPGQMLGHG